MADQLATLLPVKSRRIMSAEFWRFVFTVLVCLFHLEIYLGNQTVFPSGSSAVEFFFVLAGFTMAMSAKRNLAGRTEPVTVREAHAKAVKYVTDKLKIIYPVLIVVMLLGMLAPSFMPGESKLHMAMNTEWEWLMLVGTPFGCLEGNAPLIPLWFLTVLLIVGYIYTYAIYKNYDFMKFAAPVLGILFYVFFALNAEKILDFYILMGFINAGMVRGFAEMSFGMSIFWLYEYLSKKKLGVVCRSLLTLLLVYAVYRFFALTLHQSFGPDNYRRMVYILVIVLLSFLNADFITRGLNKLGPLWRRAGGITLTMYMCYIPVAFFYLYLVGTLKMKLWPLATKPGFGKFIWNILQDTGGRSAKFQPIPMTWKDIVFFLAMVIVTAILITLLIAAVKRFIARPLYARYKAKQAEQETAAVGN